MLNEYIQLSDEVTKALAAKKPVVAIETGGTFEGMSYPDNEDTAYAVIEAVRSCGAVPAYVSIMNGKVKVGMSKEEIARYSKLRGTLPKASRREIPQLLAQQGNGVMRLPQQRLLLIMWGYPLFPEGESEAFTGEPKRQWIYRQTWKNSPKEMLLWYVPALNPFLT